jgi:hypothetical protein
MMPTIRKQSKKVVIMVSQQEGVVYLFAGAATFALIARNAWEFSVPILLGITFYHFVVRPIKSQG